MTEQTTIRIIGLLTYTLVRASNYAITGIAYGWEHAFVDALAVMVIMFALPEIVKHLRGEK